MPLFARRPRKASRHRSSAQRGAPSFRALCGRVGIPEAQHNVSAAIPMAASPLSVPQAHNLLNVSACGDRYLIFDSHRDKRLELWRADADGSNGITPADDVRNSNCSPDGKSVLFTTSKKLHRIPIESGTPTEVLTSTPQWGGFMPSYSPDGTMLAMGYQEDMPLPVSKIGVVPAAGGALHFVGNYPFGAGNLLVARRQRHSITAHPQRRNQPLGAAARWRRYASGHQVHRRTHLRLRVVRRR